MSPTETILVVGAVIILAITVVVGILDTMDIKWDKHNPF